MSTHNIYLKYRTLKRYPIIISIMPPGVALIVHFPGLNYRCLKQIFMVPKGVEPWKFNCIWYACVLSSCALHYLLSIFEQSCAHLCKMCRHRSNASKRSFKVLFWPESSLTFHVNGLSSRKFTRNVKSYFLGKKKSKKNEIVICYNSALNSTLRVKLVMFPLNLFVCFWGLLA